MIRPLHKDIGRGVIYRAFYGAPAEGGNITSFNDHFVYVRYQSQHAEANGKATPREKLEWSKRIEQCRLPHAGSSTCPGCLDADL